MPTVGLAGAVDVLRELGPVSRSAALAGVAATAEIGAGTAVTFRFEVEVAGNYTLLVQHVGAGLDLRATGPGGSGAIDPGTAGPPRAIALDLMRGTYEVTASATRGESVFVDWELLLASGVGRLVAPSAVSILPVAHSEIAPTPAGSIGVNAVAASPQPVAPAGPTAAPLVQGSGRPSFTSIPGGLIGRSAPVATTVPPPPATPVAAAGPAAGDASTPAADLDVALTAALQAGITTGPPEPPPTRPLLDVDALTRPAARELDPTAVAAALAADLDLAAVSRGDDPAGERISLLAISPGLICGGVALTIASRGRVKARPSLFHHRGATRPGGPHRNFSMDTLRAFLRRS